MKKYKVYGNSNVTSMVYAKDKKEAYKKAKLLKTKDWDNADTSNVIPYSIEEIKENKRIKIHIYRGLVDAVEGLPEDYQYQVIDED